jgi:tRNA 2-thiouridine synthesizing protein A
MNDHSAGLDEENPQLVIDARGLACPLPVLKLRKALKDQPSGFAVVLLATDRAALTDIPAYCHAAGFEIRGCERDAGALRFEIIVRR